MTLEKLILQVLSQLQDAKLAFGHGTDNAWDEAHWLVLHVLGLPLDASIADYPDPLSESQIARVQAVLEARVRQRCPLAYLLNSAWFATLEFYVDDRVLVPRSPIGELIVERFARFPELSRIERILDLCTGSGCIAIACAKFFPQAQVVATDLSADALAVAQINIERHQLQDRVHLLQGDLWHPVSGQYDLIISNPPYVCAQEMADLPDEFHREPARALQAEESGLALLHRILRAAHHYLQPEGLLVLEAGNRAATLDQLYQDVSPMWPEFEQGAGNVLAVSAASLSARFGAD